MAIFTARFPFPANDEESVLKLEANDWLKDGRLHALEAIKLQTTYQAAPFQLWTKGDTIDPLPLKFLRLEAALAKLGEIPSRSRLQEVIFEFNDRDIAILFQLTFGGR